MKKKNRNRQEEKDPQRAQQRDQRDLGEDKNAREEKSRTQRVSFRDMKGKNPNEEADSGGRA